MAQVTTDKFSPYPRCCDVCGQLRSINTMRKLDGITWVCDKHQGERTSIMLDTLNAHARPPQTWPNENPKPQNPLYPNSLEGDEGELFNFIDQQIQNQARYEAIASGDGAPISMDIVPTMGWAARYLYKLIFQNTRPTRFITRGKVLLAQAADYLLTRQQGSPTGIVTTSTRASDAFFGGFLETGASFWITNDTAASGLALLYAYRILGSTKYLIGARSAASYLRNVQGIGQFGTHYTSSDSAGTARLNTGGLASQIWSGAGFYSSHAFYPNSLLTLELWKELTTTDGDQSLGATVAVTGFDQIPAQLMSLSITQLRTLWESGVRDSVGETFTGLSATTPREFFNAYPAAKPNFNIAGTGRWEFFDGAASTGTQVTAMNFATGLGSLYAYEGASTQATTVLEWLWTFASNEDFETADNTSTAALLRETTGDYDSTVALSTLLTVRDADDSYAAIAENGSSLYDWGAYGVLSPLWANQNLTTFKNGRVKALNIQDRYQDGLPRDGLFRDRIQLRGLSGLTYQTAFFINIDADSVQDAITPTTVTSPPTTGLVFWAEGDSGITPSSDGLRLAQWANRVANSTNPGFISDGVDAASGPTLGQDSLNGVPGVFYANSTTPIIVRLATAVGVGVRMKDRNGTLFGYGTGETQARTVVAIARAAYDQVDFDIIGGVVAKFGTTPTGGDQDFEPMFRIQIVGVPGVFTNNQQYLFANDWPTTYSQALIGPDVTGGPSGPYSGTPVFLEYTSSGFDDIHVRVNAEIVPLTPSVMHAGVPGHPATTSFTLGTVNEVGSFYDRWRGSFFGFYVWDHEWDQAERDQMTGYVSSKYGIGQRIAMVNDAVRGAMYGLSYRESHA